MIAALLLLIAAPADDDLPECNQKAAENGVQQEMNACAHREYLLADRALNAQWRLTRAEMQRRDASLAETSLPQWDDRPGYFDTLLAAQRAWLQYRDAHCRAEGYYARGGSLEPLLVSTCLTTLTEQRTEQLRALAETY